MSKTEGSARYGVVKLDDDKVVLNCWTNTEEAARLRVTALNRGRDTRTFFVLEIPTQQEPAALAQLTKELSKRQEFKYRNDRGSQS